MAGSDDGPAEQSIVGQNHTGKPRKELAGGGSSSWESDDSIELSTIVARRTSAKRG
jgi:hypothetical protein